MRLHGRPEAIAAATCCFDDIDGAVRTVITTIQLGVPVARIELLDEVLIEAVNKFSGLACPVAPTLFFDQALRSARGHEERGRRRRGA